MPGSVSSQNRLLEHPASLCTTKLSRGSQLACVLESLERFMVLTPWNFKEWPAASDSALKVTSPGEPPPKCLLSAR